MDLLASILLAGVFLGLPFYWGAFGHNGFAIPILWAVAVGIAVNFRRWQDFDRHAIPSIVITFAASVATCVVVFAVGRALGR